MSDLPPESILNVPLLDSAADASWAHARIEEEIIALFDQFRNSLLRYLLSFGLPLQDGEEIVQEVFLNLFRHLREGKCRRNLRGWVFRVGHNLALKRRASRRRESQSFDEALLERPDLIVDPSPNPEQGFASLRNQHRLLAVVDALPEHDRRCLLLRAEGLRYREIAEILEISLGAVSLSLTRSLTRMARAAER